MNKHGSYQAVFRNMPSMSFPMRLSSRPIRFGILSFGVFLILCYFFLPSRHLNYGLPEEKKHGYIVRPPSSDVTLRPIACRGPRGGPLDDPNTHDIPRSTTLQGVEFPHVATGSYEALGLEKSFMTMEQRYGPYGYGEDSEYGYNFSKVNWETIDWGALQNECFARNQARFHDGGTLEEPYQFTNASRLRYRSDGGEPTPPATQTGRTAIVLRAWSTYKYQPEDLWNIRSLITETSLATGGQFAVILLVDVKDEELGRKIHIDAEIYNEVLQASVPEELRGLAVLFHESLQVDWYPQVGTYEAIWQIMQPLQLLSHFYPEFDHFWQFELDARFTGNVGEMLTKFHNFGKSQPYKQAAERASWTYMEELHGSYEKFSESLNEAMQGGANIWGPLKSDNIIPLAPPPPVESPRNDSFQYGVGTDADLLLMNVIIDATQIQTDPDWVFRSWYYVGPLITDQNPKRYFSVPAQARASWSLLEAIHINQRDSGYRVPSEATLPSFALWHGLKIVSLPIPNFQFPQRDPIELNSVLNGGVPSQFPEGWAKGDGRYRAAATTFFARPLTWDWWSSLADPIFEQWLGMGNESGKEQGWPPAGKDPIPPKGVLPHFMKEYEGRIYCPPFMMHPRKTNQNL